MPVESPGVPDAELDAAVEHHRAGRVADAEQAYLAVLARDPAQPRAAHNLATILLQRNETGAALRWFAAAVAADPAGPWRAGYVRGLVAAGRFEAAAAVLEEAPEPWAGGPALEVDLRQRWAFALMEQEDMAGAEAQFLKVLALVPDDADALADFGALQLRRGRPAAGVDPLERAVQVAPRNLVALLNFAAALRALDRRPEAEACYRRVLAEQPDNVTAQRGLQTLAGGSGNAPARVLANEALALNVVGRPAEALKRLEQAIAADPDDPSLRYDLAYVRLAMGDFAGWDDYEARFLVDTAPDIFPRKLLGRLEHHVARDSLAGADLLVTFEQGLGDQIMFASMLPDLAAEAGDLVCLCEPRLVGLFSHAFPDIQFTAAARADRRVIAAGSLGRLYRRERGQFPGAPYLQARPEFREKWAARLGPRPEKLRIGLSWKGGVATTRAHRRSLPLSAMAPLLDLPGCDYVSLQYGDPRAEVAAVNESLTRKIQVFAPEEIKDFDDLAGLVENLDVVVSVQTAVVHLCGALGKPCLALIPFQAEWRYGAAGETMPWYGSVRLFRQPTLHDWDPVIAAVRTALVSSPSG